MTLIYLCIFSVSINLKVISQLVLLFLIVTHWCCGTVIYIMIMRSGILGGMLSFIRYVLLEGIMNTVLLSFPDNIRKTLSMFITLDQCASVTMGSISVARTIAIVMSLIVEVLILLVVYGYTNKKRDFA